MNPGYKKEEIEKLQAECEAEGRPYVIVLDEIEDQENDQYAHFQFVGEDNGKKVIYDVLLQTLALHYNSVIYETAEDQVKNEYPGFLPFELREANYVPNEEADERVEEIVDEIEEFDEIKVFEYVDIDRDFEFGIGVEASLNFEQIGDPEIRDFIKRFNSGNMQLDETLYTFKHEEDED